MAEHLEEIILIVIGLSAIIFSKINANFEIKWGLFCNKLFGTRIGSLDENKIRMWNILGGIAFIIFGIYILYTKHIDGIGLFKR